MQTKFEIPAGYNWHIVMVRMYKGVLECSLYGSYTTEKQAEQAKTNAGNRSGWDFVITRDKIV